MSQGYSLRLRDLNMKADQRKLGVRLGKACIEHNVPVMVVAERMGVSRATVYNWFCGASAPRPTIVSSIESFLASIQ